jgi:ABC-2 type transport system ATP-binding protein
MTRDVVLEAVDLTKRYRGTRGQPGKLALDHLNLVVRRGEIFGYLGPNGAGKTTTIRLILDLIRPSEGRVQVMSMDARRDSVAVKRLLGNLPSEVRLWDHLTGIQVLQYLDGLRPGGDFRYALLLAERLDLNLHQRVRSYSTGNRRKLGIVQALMHRPQLLILDEPSAGLDPLVSHTFHTIIREARDEGRTIFFSSHVLSEVEQVCDTVGVLRDGRLQAVERISDLNRVRFRWVTIYTHAPLDLADWAALDGVSEASLIPRGIRMQVRGSLDPVVKLASRYPVEDMTVVEPSLEDFFMTFYGQTGNG